MAHAEKLMALLQEEQLRQMRVTMAREKPPLVRLRTALASAEDQLERAGKLMADIDQDQGGWRSSQA